MARTVGVHGVEPVGPRRFLIATAVSHYPHAPEWDRPGLVEARRQVVELFTGKLGYEHVSDLGANPTQQQLLRELREFCRAPERREDDIVAVYIAGHGEVLEDSGEYVLLTSDTEPDDLYDALQPSVLARKILAGTKVRRLLLMLDTCYSGQGGNELLATMARLKNSWSQGDSGLAVITSAQPLELARTGAFPELLTEAVTSVATAGHGPELLALDAVVKATLTNPERPDFQHIGLEIIGLTGEIPPFLPNAKHSPRLSHTDLALQQAAEWAEQDALRDVEFRTRLLRRAMGHRDENRVGWWFSGRHRALADITAWLGELPDDRPALVVTGDPGSGKTALLGLLAAVSDPEHRRTVPMTSLGLRRSELPGRGAIRTAVYAQSLTDQQVVRALAAALRLPPTEAVAELLNHLNEQPEPARPRVVLIDGLDEAATPATLCSQVLRPVMDLAGAHVRLLLGTRPHLFTPLGLRRADHVDLDAAAYADPEAVLTYTVRNLMEAHPDSPYLECDRDLRLAVAGAVAEAAGHSFLVARITAGTLAATAAVPDPWDAVWRRSLPSAAADAMHRDLHQRFGEGAERILDLLRPLAYAEGQGLPWEDIWAPLASELAGRRYTNQDLHVLRRDAGAYVVEAVEDGRSVYRLYHEAMAEYLRQGRDAGQAHRAFTVALRRAVPYAWDGGLDWGRAHPYALRHLAAHAAAGGLLDELLSDLEYLVHADCDSLAPQLLKTETETARLHAAIYMVSLNVHRGLDAEGRRQLLAVNAARFNAPTVLEEFNGRAAEGAWKPVAASGSQVSGNTRNVLSGHAATLRAVACTELDGRPVAVTGAQDHTVQVWDLATGQSIGSPLTGRASAVDKVACTELDGRPVALTVSLDHTVQIWDLTTGELVGEPLTRHTGNIRAVVCTVLAGRPVAVTGSQDGTIRVWDIATGRAVGPGMRLNSNLTTLTCALLDGRPVAVTSSTDSTVRVWDLVTRTELGRLEGKQTWAVSLASTELEGRPVVLGGGPEGKLHLWDLTTFRLLAEWYGHSDWVRSMACARMEGRSIAVTGSRDTRLAVWDLATRRQMGPDMSGHSSSVWSVACASLSGQTVAVSLAADGSLRLWDLPPRPDIGRPVRAHSNDIRGMELSMVNERSAFVTVSDDKTARVWDLTTGLPVGKVVAAPGEANLMSCAVLDGRPVAVTYERSGYSVWVWDIETGQALYPPIKLHYESLAVLACSTQNGRPIILGASVHHKLRAWHLATGEAVCPPIKYTGLISEVAGTVLNGRPVAVTVIDKAVHVWDMTTGRSVGRSMPGRMGPLACTVLDDRPVLVSCWDGHALLVRDLRTGRPIGKPLTGHTRAVLALQCAELDGRPVVLSGSWDNTVRIWDLRTGTNLHTIHVPGHCRALALDHSGVLACSFGSDVGVFRR